MPDPVSVIALQGRAARRALGTVVAVLLLLLAGVALAAKAYAQESPSF